METNIKKKKVAQQQKIVPKGTVVFKNEPNFDLMAQAYIDFHHKTKHYL